MLIVPLGMRQQDRFSSVWMNVISYAVMSGWNSIEDATPPRRTAFGVQSLGLSTATVETVQRRQRNFYA
jgi:hypothetical protein